MKGEVLTRGGKKGRNFRNRQRRGVQKKAVGDARGARGEKLCVF